VVYTGLRSDYIKNHASRNEAGHITATHITFTRISCNLFTCDMYMCRLRHINDPVLSSLKMEGICLLLFSIHMCITLHVSSVKRSSSEVPRRTYSLQFLCLCLSAALSCKFLTRQCRKQTQTQSYTHIDRK
jgi:hypothetical protein